PPRQKLLRFRPKGIHACKHLRWCIVPGHQSGGRLHPPAALPALDEPLRMRKPERRLLGFQIRQEPLRRFEFAQISPQHSVYEARLWSKTRTFGLFDRFMHRGVVWYLIEPQNVIESKPQRALQLFFW